MQATISDTLHELASTLKALEAVADRSFVDVEQRRERRSPLRARCDVYLFKGYGAETVTRNAVARNLTFGGLSLVFITEESVCPGRPVEVLVTIPDHHPTHLAGVVAFCREVEDGCFELGIEVKAVGRHAILVDDTRKARILYDWFAAALRLPE